MAGTPALKAWVPGQSGNGWGRPSGWQGASKFLKSICGEHMEKALTALLRMAFDPDTPPAVKLAAIVHALDRGLGKPPTEVMLQVGPARAAQIDLRRLTDEELEQYLALAKKALVLDDDKTIDATSTAAPAAEAK